MWILQLEQRQGFPGCRGQRLEKNLNMSASAGSQTSRLPELPASDSFRAESFPYASPVPIMDGILFVLGVLPMCWLVVKCRVARADRRAVQLADLQRISQLVQGLLLLGSNAVE